MVSCPALLVLRTSQASAAHAIRTAEHRKLAHKGRRKNNKAKRAAVWPTHEALLGFTHIYICRWTKLHLLYRDGQDRGEASHACPSSLTKQLTHSQKGKKETNRTEGKDRADGANLSTGACTQTTGTLTCYS